jgi:isopenicillin N synthase-like dioxygenase
VRAAAHEDINLITLLPAATESGLELLDRDGSWHPVDGLEGEIVVDAGDMLSRHVNNVIPSTTHRVVNPDTDDVARYSMPFFCHPRPEVLLDAPATLVGEGEKHFAPITADDFLNQRLAEIGLA